MQSTLSSQLSTAIPPVTMDTQTEINDTTTNTKPYKPRSKLSVAILKAKEKNPELTTRKIAKLTDTSHVNVIRVLHAYGYKLQEVEDYQSNESKLWAGLRQRIHKTITDDDIQKAPFGTKITAMAIAQDKQLALDNKGNDAGSVVINIVNEIKSIQCANDD